MYKNIDEALRNAKKTDVPSSTFAKVDNVLNNLEHRKEEKYMKTKFIKIVAIAAAVTILAAGAVAAYTTIGGLDGLIAMFNPAFGKLATETLVHAEDQGIRIDVYGAQRYNDTLLLYYSIADTSGQNRITRYDHPEIEIHNQYGNISGGYSSNLLHFDKDTGTAYSEARFQLNETASSDVLEFVVTEIRSYKVSGNPPVVVAGDWRMSLDLAAIEEQNIVLSDIDVAAKELNVKYVSISPLGIQMKGTHDGSLFTNTRKSISVEVELSNRRGNIKPQGQGSGIGEGDFEAFFSFAAPIEVESVSAIIVNGVRIPCYRK